MPSVSSTTGLTQVNAGTIQDTSPPGPNFKGELGQTYYQKGTSNFYISNGSEWFLIPISSGGSTFIGGDLFVTRNAEIGANLQVDGDGNFLQDVSIAQNAEITGNLQLLGAGSQLQINGGAVTDSLSTTTLALGVATVLNTSILATDRIIPFHIAPNASTALGILTYTITPNTSFVISSRNPTDATVQTGDLSTIGYLIIRQL